MAACSRVRAAGTLLSESGRLFYVAGGHDDVVLMNNVHSGEKPEVNDVFFRVASALDAAPMSDS